MSARSHQEEAVVLVRHGGPEELRLDTVEVGEPGSGELAVRHTAIGVNFHDCYVRSGLYQTLALPGVPGIESVGVVEGVGPDVDGFELGDRIGWVDQGYGGYSAARLLPADLALKLPSTLTDVQWAVTLMKAFTACVLVYDVGRVTAGQTVLVHAAGGGMGQMLSRWCRHLGATVIGTVGSPEKADLAERAGAHAVTSYRDGVFAPFVHEATRGEGVDVVFDSVGRSTFDDSLEALGYRGTLVSYGQASGPVDAIAPSRLATRSLSLTRPIIFHYLRSRADREALATAAFDAIERGIVVPVEPAVFPLAAASAAHEMLESRKSPGGIALVP